MLAHGDGSVQTATVVLISTAAAVLLLTQGVRYKDLMYLLMGMSMVITMSLVTLPSSSTTTSR